MYKKFFVLSSFVLVLGLSVSTAVAELVAYVNSSEVVVTPMEVLSCQ